jgi:hypothetical protein
MMSEYVLSRSGTAPLKFNGELLSSANCEYVGGQQQNRYHEIDIYRTASGKYVLAINYHTRWQGEHGTHDVTTHEDINGVISQLTRTNPIGTLIGFPLGNQYIEKQMRLEDALRANWNALVTEVLEDVPEAAESIE